MKSFLDNLGVKRLTQNIRDWAESKFIDSDGREYDPLEIESLRQNGKLKAGKIYKIHYTYDLERIAFKSPYGRPSFVGIVEHLYLRAINEYKFDENGYLHPSSSSTELIPIKFKYGDYDTTLQQKEQNNYVYRVCSSSAEYLFASIINKGNNILFKRIGGSTTSPNQLIIERSEIRYNNVIEIDGVEYIISYNGLGTITWMKDENNNETNFNNYILKDGSKAVIGSNNIVKSDIGFVTIDGNNNTVEKGCQAVKISGNNNIVEEKCIDINIYGDENIIKRNCIDINLYKEEYTPSSKNIIGKYCTFIDINGTRNKLLNNVVYSKIIGSSNNIGHNCSYLYITGSYNNILNNNINITLKRNFYKIGNNCNTIYLDSELTCLVEDNSFCIGQHMEKNNFGLVVPRVIYDPSNFSCDTDSNNYNKETFRNVISSIIRIINKYGIEDVDYRYDGASEFYVDIYFDISELKLSLTEGEIYTYLCNDKSYLKLYIEDGGIQYFKVCEPIKQFIYMSPTRICITLLFNAFGKYYSEDEQYRIEFTTDGLYNNPSESEASINILGLVVEI